MTTEFNLAILKIFFSVNERTDSEVLLCLRFFGLRLETLVNIKSV